MNCNNSSLVVVYILCVSFCVLCTPPSGLFPTRSICGFQQKDDRNETRSVTVLDEFPWLARLGYHDGVNNELHYMCIGTIITKKYILTAAQCMYPRGQEILTNVRLGEYDPTQDIDCTDNDHGRKCRDPVVDIPVESNVTHSLYNALNKTNDISLVRLKTSINYSDFIRPICLLTSGIQFSQPGSIVVTSGWGVLNRIAEVQIFNRKKKAENQLISLSDCKETLRKKDLRRPVVLTEQHLCTLEHSEESSCTGDSGGPVMFKEGGQWYVEGIVSFGVGCGNGTIGVNTRVASYVDWIIENVKP